MKMKKGIKIAIIITYFVALAIAGVFLDMKLYTLSMAS